MASVLSGCTTAGTRCRLLTGLAWVYLAARETWISRALSVAYADTACGYSCGYSVTLPPLSVWYI